MNLSINKEVTYVASFSAGKDSLAMLLRLMAEKRPLDYVLFYDTGMEYTAIYNIVERIRPIVETYGAKFVVLKPDTDFLTEMLLKPVKYRDGNGEHYGMDWCGGNCRWRTAGKITTINRFLNSIEGDIVQYIGIAFDEPERVDYSNNKTYPLVEWQMTEAMCLKYCYDNGYDWKEGDIDLYSILDRVSCWCCKNKNLKELRNMYHFLPEKWGLLKGMQSRIDRPFYHDQTIFELEERFKAEDAQITLWDII